MRSSISRLFARSSIPHPSQAWDHVRRKRHQPKEMGAFFARKNSTCRLLDPAVICPFSRKATRKGTSIEQPGSLRYAVRIIVTPSVSIHQIRIAQHKEFQSENDILASISKRHGPAQFDRRDTLRQEKKLPIRIATTVAQKSIRSLGAVEYSYQPNPGDLVDGLC